VFFLLLFWGFDLFPLGSGYYNHNTRLLGKATMFKHPFQRASIHNSYQASSFTSSKHKIRTHFYLSAVAGIWSDQYYAEEAPLPEEEQDFSFIPQHLVETDLKRQVMVYEVTLYPPLGLRLIQTKNDGVKVDGVIPRSSADRADIRNGDKVVATSATFGDQLWPKSNLDGVVSALNTRFFLGQPATVRFERNLQSKLMTQLKHQVKVRETYQVGLHRPVGLELQQGMGGEEGVFVKALIPGGNAEKLGIIQTGDRVIAVTASLGDKLWKTSTVEGVVSAVTTRKMGMKVVFQLQRTVNLGNWVPPELRSRSNSTDDHLDSDKAAVRVALGKALEEYIALLKTKATTDAAQLVIMERSLSLLQSFGAVESWMSIDYLMSRLKESGIPITARVWNRAMSACISAGRPALAITYFNELRAANCKMDCHIVATLIKAYTQLEDYSSANKVLSSLDEWCVDADQVVFNSLISANVKAGNLAAAEAIFKTEMPRCGVTPNQRSYNILINGFAREKLVDQAYKLFDEMSQQGIAPDLVTFTTLMKARMAKGELIAATKLLITMEESYSLTPDVTTYNTLIEGLMKRRRWQEALQVQKMMKGKGVLPDAMTYSYIIGGLMKARRPHRALMKFNEMKQRGLMPNVVVYTSVISAYSKCRLMDRAVAVLKEMKANSVRPNIQTFSAVMEACLRSGQPSVAMAVFTEIKRGGLQADLVMYTLLIRAFGQQGQLRKAFNVLKAVKNQGIEPNSHTYNALIEACCQWAQYGRALVAFEALLTDGLEVNEATLQALTVQQAESETKKSDFSSRLASSLQGQQDWERVDNRLEFLQRVVSLLKGKRNRPISSILYLALLDECVYQREFQLGQEIITLNQVHKNVAILRAHIQIIQQLETMIAEKLPVVSTGNMRW